MRVEVQGRLRFASKAALDRGRRAFVEHAYPEYFEANVLQIDALAVSIERAFEVGADCDAWPAFRALALEAAEGAVVLLDPAGGVDDGRVALHRSPGAALAARWEHATFTSSSPTGERWLREARAALRAFGAQVAAEPETFEVWLVSAPSNLAVWKALFGTCGIGLSDAKSITSNLPQRVLARVDAARAEQARAALVAAGSDATVSATRAI